MIDSPCHAYDQTRFTITERGVQDAEEKRLPLRIQRLNGESIMSTIGIDNRRRMLRTIPQEREYPDPQTLPVTPSWQQPRPQLTLSELIPGKYVATTARIVYLKTSDRHDALGNKLVFSGLLEDSTFKVPFVSHRISYPLIRNSVYKFYSAYVHEFEDKSDAIGCDRTYEESNLKILRIIENLFGHRKLNQ